jgi:hypothetical protein
MQDETQLISKADAPPNGNGGTGDGGPGNPPRPNESMLGGQSGRFWIAMMAMTGLIAMPGLWILLALACAMNGIQTLLIDATTFLSVYGVFGGIAGTVAATYIGQGQKPKGQSA